MKMRLLTFTALYVAAAGSAHATEAASADQAGSQWPYEYMRGDYVVPCPDDEKANCRWHRLVVDNQSDDTLICNGHMTYDAPDRDKAAEIRHRLVVLAHSRVAVVADTTGPDVKVTTHDLSCTIRPPLDISKLTLKCKPILTTQPDEAPYPIASRQAGEEGPVLVDFSLTDKVGPATDVKVAGSSLWPKLDAAGVQYVSQFVGKTDCKHGRFRVPVVFRLR